MAQRRAHSVRLLRSPPRGIGMPLPPDIVRGTLVVRLAQMAAGGGGHRAEVADALIAALAGGPLPELRNLGGIGTGDLTLLGQLGLALEARGLEIQAGDALALMSSNAATFASARRRALSSSAITSSSRSTRSPPSERNSS